MPENAAIFNRTQIGVETTPGTAVAALKALSGVTIDPAFKAEIGTFAPAGNKFDTIAWLGKEWGEADIVGQAMYTELVYLLSSLIKAATPTQMGGGTLAYQWVFSPSQSGMDITKTLTVENGNAGSGGAAARARRMAYGLVKELGMNFTRKEVKLSGSMLGQALADNAQLSTNQTYTLTANASPPTAGTFTLTKSGQTTGAIAYNATPAAVQSALEALSTIGAGNVVVSLTSLGPTLAVANSVYTIEFRGDLAQQAVTLTGTFTGLTASGSIALAAGTAGAAPTYLEAVPVVPTQVSLYLADTAAGLAGATAMSRDLTADWKFGNRFGPAWFLNASQTGFGGHVELKPDLTTKLVAAVNDEGMSLLANMRAGSTKFTRLKCVGPTIEATNTYLLQIDMAGKIKKEPDKIGEQDGLAIIGWELGGVYDATWGKALEVTVQNRLNTL